MTKNIGLSQKLKFSWLKKTVEIVSSDEDTGLPRHCNALHCSPFSQQADSSPTNSGGASSEYNDEFIKRKISEYLSFEIKSPTNIRKITKILMNIWVSNIKDLQINALELIKKYPEYSLVINWCLILTAYPVFTDICSIIGKIAKFQEIITNNQIKEKMFEEWGERSTLFYSVEKTLGTIIELGALKPIKKGSYSLCKYDINNDEIIDFMLKSILMSKSKESSKTINELQNLACFFPFNYKINENCIINNNSFKTVNLGGNLNISVA